MWDSLCYGRARTLLRLHACLSPAKHMALLSARLVSSSMFSAHSWVLGKLLRCSRSCSGAGVVGGAACSVAGVHLATLHQMIRINDSQILGQTQGQWVEPRRKLAPSHASLSRQPGSISVQSSGARPLLLAMAAQTEALSRLDVTPDVGHGPDEAGSPRDDYVLVDSGESETPEPVRSPGAMR